MKISTQVILLAIVNAFVGSLLGVERSIMPLIAEQVFGVKSGFVVLSFIVAFGLAKITMNYYGGKLAGRFGRKKLLVAGWIIGAFVPVLFIFAQNWYWLIAANIILGIHQGLTWSMTLLMKIDQTDDSLRGKMVGLNEFSGYFALAISAFLSSLIAKEYGIFPYPFYLSAVIVFMGLVLSIFFVKDTTPPQYQAVTNDEMTSTKAYFACSVNCIIHAFTDKNQRTVIIGGLMNNLNDALAWGVFPLLLLKKGFDIGEIGVIAALYPMSWGAFQLLTGAWSDRVGRKPLMVSGMILQGIVLILMANTEGYPILVALSILLGFGTALVYPVFIAAIVDNAEPSQRAIQLGVYRFWRDSGFVIGAVISAILLQTTSVEITISVVGFLTILTGFFIQFQYNTFRVLSKA